jgi:hypothetical protein
LPFGAFLDDCRTRTDALTHVNGLLPAGSE